MKYLLTGASGFLGRHILEALPRENVTTLGRGKTNDLVVNLSTSVPDLQLAEIIIHCAGKAHVVPKTLKEEEEFFSVNLEGTRNLLKGLEKLVTPPHQFIFISTVAVYGKESGTLISESYPILGDSPYAQSKIQAEQLLLEWGKSHGVPVVIFRLPLIVGPNPPGNLGKMIKGIREARYASIAGGKARKSMVLASDVAQLISQISSQSGTYNLTDCYHPTLNELELVIATEFKRSIKFKIPISIAKMIGILGDVIPFFPVNSKLIKKMSSDLTFDDSKAKKELNWKPNQVVNFKFIS